VSSRTYDIAFRLNAKLGSKYGKAFQQAQSKAEQLATTLNAVGRRMTLAVTTPLVALGTAAVVIGSDMENTMGTIRARTQLAAEEVAQLERNFRDLAMGSDYFSLTAREFASAASEVVVEGQEVAHVTDLMRYSAVLASAANTDLGRAAGFLNLALVKTQSDISSAERYINAFAQTTALSGMSMGNLEKAIITLAPTMNQTGASMEEMTGALAQLYQGGLYGVQAGRGLEQIVNQLRNAVNPTTGEIADLGVAFFDSAGYMRPFNDIMLETMDAIEGLSTEQERMNATADLFSTVYATAVFDELMNNRDAWQGNIATMYEATAAMDGTGRAFEMAAIQNDGMAGSTAQLRASMEELMLQISEHLMPHAISLIGVVTSAVEWFGNLDESTQRNIIRFAALAAAIGPAMIITSKLIKIFVAGRQAVQGFTLAKAGYAAMATKSAAATGATVAGATAYNIVAKAGTAATKAWAASKAVFATVIGLVTGKIKIATVAQKIWNIIMKMNPIFLLVAVIMAVIVALAALAMCLFRSSEETRRLQEETDALIERQQALTDSIYNSAAAFDQQMRDMQVATDEFTHQANRVYELANAYDLTAFEMENLAYDIAALNQAIPGLNLAFNEQTGELNMTAEALQRYIGLAEKQLEIDASRARQLELVRERSQAEYELVALQEQQAAVQEALNNLGGHQFIQRGRLNDQLDDLIAAEEALNYALANNFAEYENLGEVMAQNARYLEDHRRMQEEAAIATYGFEMAMRRAAFTAEEWADAQEDALDRMNSAFESYKRVTTNVFDTVNQRAYVSIAEMTANLTANANAVEEWSKNMAILHERFEGLDIDQALLDQLRDAGPEMAATIQGLVDACDYELAALGDAFENSTIVAMEAMQRELDPMGVAGSAEELIDHVALAILENQAMENALIDKVNAGFAAFANTIDNVGFDNEGYNISHGIGQGVRDGSIYLERAMVYISQNSEAALRNYWAMNSPSRKMRGFGKKLMGSMSDGMYSMTGELIKTCKDVSEAISDNLVVVPHAVAELMQSGKVAGYISASGVVKAPTNTEDNAVSSLTSFSRYENLQATGTDGPAPYNSPVAAMSRLDEANATYGGDTMSFHYAPVIQISGGGYDNGELENVISNALQGTYGEVEKIVKRVISEDQDKKRRLKN